MAISNCRSRSGKKTRAVDRMTEPPSSKKKMADRRVLEIMPIWRGTGRFYGAGGEDVATSSLQSNRWSAAMPQPNDLSRSLVALDHNSTIIAVVELSQSSWLVGGVVPGIERQPRKKLEPSPERLLAVLHRWRAFRISDLYAPFDSSRAQRY